MKLMGQSYQPYLSDFEFWFSNCYDGLPTHELLYYHEDDAEVSNLDIIQELIKNSQILSYINYYELYINSQDKYYLYTDCSIKLLVISNNLNLFRGGQVCFIRAEYIGIELIYDKNVKFNVTVNRYDINNVDVIELILKCLYNPVNKYILINHGYLICKTIKNRVFITYSEYII